MSISALVGILNVRGISKNFWVQYDSTLYYCFSVCSNMGTDFLSKLSKPATYLILFAVVLVFICLFFMGVAMDPWYCMRDLFHIRNYRFSFINERA